MRVLLTADTVGGVWTYALELARALEPHGVHFTLATMGAPLSPTQRREVAALSSSVEVFDSAYKLEWMDDPWDDVARAGDWLLDLERRVCPDIVHLNGYAHGNLPWRAPTLVVGHSCVLSWWRAVHGEAAPASWDRYRAVVTAGLHAADFVAAPTRAMLAALETHYGLLPAATGVLFNGRDARLFAPGDKQPFVLVAGRLWDAAKNIPLLSEAAPYLPWPVYVAGVDRAPEGGAVQPNNLRRLGHLAPPDLADWLGRAAIYALPARYEPFGLSVLEAGLSGCALVLGDLPSLREVWGDAALFVSPNDPCALSNAIRRLIQNAALRDQMAARALRRAREFTPQRMAAGYLAVYQQLQISGCHANRSVLPLASFGLEPRERPLPARRRARAASARP